MNFYSSLLHVSSTSKSLQLKINLFLTSWTVFVGSVHGAFELIPIPHRASLLPSLQSSQWAIIQHQTDPKMGAEGNSLKQARKTLLWYGP